MGNATAYTNKSFQPSQHFAVQLYRQSSDRDLVNKGKKCYACVKACISWYIKILTFAYKVSVSLRWKDQFLAEAIAKSSRFFRAWYAKALIFIHQANYWYWIWKPSLRFNGNMKICLDIKIGHLDIWSHSEEHRLLGFRTNENCFFWRDGMSKHELRI